MHGPNGVYRNYSGAGGSWVLGPAPAPAHPLAVLVRACPPPPPEAGNRWPGARPSLGLRRVMRGRTNAK